MPSPGPIQSLVRPDIRNRVTEVWSQTGEAGMFIADKICKRIDVDFASGTAIRIPREAFTKDTATLDRSPEGTYQEIEYKTDTLQYATKEQGVMIRVDANIANQSKIYFDAEVVAGKVALSHLLRNHEKTVAAQVMSTTNFTGAKTASAAANWRTSASSATPVQDILAARKAVRLACGREANTLVVDWLLWQYLRETSQILGRITGGSRQDDPASVTTEDVSKVVEIPNIVVAHGIKDGANMGQAFSGSGIWDPTMAWVGYVNPGASLQDISCFHAYNWEGDGGSWDFTFESFWSDEKRGNVVRGRRQVGVKAEYTECGYLITGAG